MKKNKCSIPCGVANQAQSHYTRSMASNEILELQQRIQQLKRLVELSVTLNSVLDLDTLLQLVTSTATELLDCEAASILLYDEKQPQLYFAAATGSDPKKLAEVPVPIEGSVAGTVFRTNHSIIVNDAEQDPRHYSLVSEHIRFHVQSLIGVPMLIKDRVMGVLEAVNKRGKFFEEPDETILSVIASHAAIAIENARLLASIRQSLEKVSESDRLKGNFLSLASHELRTPLGIIIGYASFLREDAKGELSEHAQHVLDAALQMRSLVEDMTNLTMLETEGLMIVKPQFISIQSILEKASDEVRQIASAHEHKLTFAFREAPITVNVDPDKTVSVFVNLLIMRSASRRKEARLLSARRSKEVRVMAWVQDHGIEIAEDKVEENLR